MRSEYITKGFNLDPYRLHILFLCNSEATYTEYSFKILSFKQIKQYLKQVEIHKCKQFLEAPLLIDSSLHSTKVTKKWQQVSLLWHVLKNQEERLFSFLTLAFLNYIP